MAHYAFLDENNIVTEVIVGRNEDEVVDGISDWEAHYGEFRGQTCKRTSYNNNIRGTYAGIGYSYNLEEDIFIAPQPYPSWILTRAAQWVAPVKYPTDGIMYQWNEELTDWEVINYDN